MLRTTIALLALLSIQLPGHSQDPLPDSLKQSLHEAQHRMFETFGAGDGALLESFTGSDYITINADGALMDREGMMALLPKFKGSTTEVIGQQDRLYGDLAVSTGRAKFRFGSFLVADVYFTQLWIYRQGAWSYIGWQGTMTGAPRYYSIILLLAGVGLVLAVTWFVRRRNRMKRKNA